MIVDNIAGNSGAIGVDRVAKAAPDGYTLMWTGNAAVTILPSLQRLPFDPVKDFAHITTTLVTGSVIMVNNDLPVKTLADLVAYAKANPGKLSTAAPASARRSISPARCCRRPPASRWSTCPIAARS